MSRWLKERRILIIVALTLLLCLLTGWTLYLLLGHQLFRAMCEGRVASLEHHLGRGEHLFLKISLFLIPFCLISIFYLSLLSKRYSFAASVCLAILLGGCILQIFAGYSGRCLACHAWGHDDAYISYRYARNLSQGNGLVFNQGERVEGYSAFLYVLLMSLGHIALGQKSVYPFSCFLNIFFIAFAFFIFYKYILEKFGHERAAMAAFLFALCPPMWVWVSSGMETPLVLLLQLAIWINVERVSDRQNSANILVLCLLMTISMLARADGFILPAIAILYLLLRGKRRAMLYCGITVTLVMAVYFLWRYSYYGYFLPNSYYVKVSGPVVSRLRHAFIQLLKETFRNGLLVYLLVFSYGLFKILKNAIRNGLHIVKQIRFDSLFVVCWILYWIYIGGDHLEDRLLTILFPLGIFALLKFVGKTLQKKTLIFLMILMVIIQMRPLGSDERFRYSLSKYDFWVTLGRFLGEEHPGETLAICAAGKVPYFSRLRTIDMLGLNDEFIAHGDVKFFSRPGHNKSDPDYVLSRSPDIIATWIRRGSMDLTFGLKRKKYEKNYSLRYLVNRTPRSFDRNIIDVAELGEDAIDHLILSGYGFAVLEKK